MPGAVFGEVVGWIYLSMHWKWRFICDANHWSQSFFVAGAIFGEVGGWLFVTGAALRDILGDGRDAKCCILEYKIVSEMGRVRSPNRRVPDADFMVGLSSDYPWIILGSSFYWRKHFRDFPLKSWASRFCFVVGAILDEVGGWVHLPQALEMTFQIWRGSLMTFMLHARRSIWWGCRVNLLVHALEMTCHMWRKSLITFILRGRRNIWWGWRMTFRDRRSTSWHLGDSRDAKCCILEYKIVSKIGRVRSPKRRVPDDDFMVKLSSGYPWIILGSSFYWRKHFRDFPLKSV